jgi:hypothetical protein
MVPPDAQPDPNRPGLPLILGGWWTTTDSEKRARFIEHILYGHQIGKLEEVDSFLRSLSEDDWHYDQQMNFEPLRDRLCGVASKWQEKYRVSPSIMSAISEYDAARIIGMSEEEYAGRERGITSGFNFIYNDRRYRVLGRRERRSERPESIVIRERPRHYKWDYFIWILYNESYVIREVRLWEVASYEEYFEQKDRMSLRDMRLGENLLHRR